MLPAHGGSLYSHLKYREKACFAPAQNNINAVFLTENKGEYQRLTTHISSSPRRAFLHFVAYLK